MNFTTTLLACLLAGVAFAALAAWLTTRKGNTISDLAKSQQLQNAEAIKIEVLNTVKLSSNIPIVGLYVVAAAVAVGLPTFIYWAAHRDVSAYVVLSGFVQGPAPVGSLKVYPVLHDSYVNPSTGAFHVPLVFNAGEPPHDVSLQGSEYHPVGMSVALDRVADTLNVQFAGTSRVDSVRLQEHSAILTTPIQLTLHQAQATPANDPSQQPAVPAALADAVPPSGSGQ